VFSKDGLLDALKKALAEGSLDAELGHHLAGERAQARAETARNHRNWHSRWQVGTDSAGRPGGMRPPIDHSGRRGLPGLEPIPNTTAIWAREWRAWWRGRDGR
jgi:hypothetical protein